MTAVNYVLGPASVLTILVGMAILALAARSIYRTVKLGAADPTRAAQPKKRGVVMLAEVAGHVKMLKRRRVAIAHFFVMVGFGALFITLVEAVGETFNPAFEIPLIGHWAPYGLFVEILALTTVVSIVGLVIARQVQLPGRSSPARSSRFFGSNMGQAYFVEFVVLAVGVCILLIRGFKAASGLSGFPRWAAPVSHLLGDILPPWPVAVSVVAFLKIAISMMWAIVISQKTTMGVAWHRFLAFFNIFFKREIGVGVPALGAVKPMMSNGAVVNLEEADPEKDTIGVGKVEDFTWKDWLDFTTCTECGRCQSQCPAWNTEKPLSPKLLTMALRDHAHAKAPYLAAGGGLDMAGQEKATKAQLAGIPDAAKAAAGLALVGDDGVISPDVLWSCTTCGACVEQCPVDIEHVDHIVDMRRYQVLIESEFPTELGGLFRNLENKSNPWGQNNSDRLAWTKDLGFEVPVVAGTLKDDTEYLFWVGCAGAFDDRARKTTRAIAELLHLAGVSYEVLGTAETCTGDAARRAGNEFLFQMLAQEVVGTLETAFGSRDKRTVVVSCAHCFNTFANEYPSLGGKYRVLHHTQLLNQLVRDGRLVPVATPEPNGQPVTYHDPCYLGRHNKIYSPPRELIAASGVSLVEMPRHGSKSFCCGAGGARMWTEEKLGSRINLNRIDEAVATGAGHVVTGCPFCRVMLSDGLRARQSEGVDEANDVLDVAQLLLSRVRGGHSAEVPESPDRPDGASETA